MGPGMRSGNASGMFGSGAKLVAATCRAPGQTFALGRIASRVSLFNIWNDSGKNASPLN